MGHGKATFRQTDLTRALRAVEKAGCDVARAEIAPDSRIVLVFKNGEEIAAYQKLTHARFRKKTKSKKAAMAYTERPS
jgi:hypothetical protein